MMKRIILLIIAGIVAILLILGIVTAIFHTSLFPAKKTTTHTTSASATGHSSDNGTSSSAVATTPTTPSTQESTSSTNSADIPSTGPSDPIVIAMATLILSAGGYGGARLVQVRIRRSSI